MKIRATRSSGFQRLEATLRSGSDHPLVLLRATPYQSYENAELLRDVLALANVPTRGQRFIVFGARREAASNRTELTGLSPEDHAHGPDHFQFLCDYVEPVLNLRFIRWRVDQVTLGLLVISDCEDTPYLVRKGISSAVRSGDSWIRSGGRVRRLNRQDLDRLYIEKLADPPFKGRVRVQFATDPPSEFVSLPVVRFPELPSAEAERKIRALLVAKDLAGQAGASQITHLGRLAYARVYGSDMPYEDKGVQTLRSELSQLAQRYEAADAHYRFEQRAHRLNFAVTIEGDQAIEAASLVLQVPASAGVEIGTASDAVPPGDNDDVLASPAAVGRRYPNVELMPEVIRVSQCLALRPGGTVPAFQEPLRVLVGAAALGYKIPVHYHLSGRNLRFPVTGKLYIVCTE